MRFYSHQREQHPHLQPVVSRRSSEGGRLRRGCYRARGLGGERGDRSGGAVRRSRPVRSARSHGAGEQGARVGSSLRQVLRRDRYARLGRGRATGAHAETSPLPSPRSARTRGHDRRAGAITAGWRTSARQKTLILTLETRACRRSPERLMQLDSIYFAPVEWSGTMPMMNWASTGRQVRWILRDPDTGRENMDVDWRLRRGEPVRIRLVNERQSVPRDAAPDPPARPALPDPGGQRRAATRTRSGRTPCWCRRAPRWIFCSTHPIPAAGCCTATSPSTSRPT